MSETESDCFGVVLIGRNEGERLRLSLESVLKLTKRVVYADSASSDGSVQLARSLGAVVVELDPSKPLNAARGRNAGFDALRHHFPECRYVLFLDGDCRLVESFPAKAISFLNSHEKAAIACGRRFEAFPNASFYNRMADEEWNTPVGQAEACGGDSMVRIDALEEVGGFDANLMASEEPEMAARLRALGWQIWRIDAEMSEHDAAIHHFGQWWRRTLRSGYGYAQAWRRTQQLPRPINGRILASAFFWVVGVPLAAVLLSLLLGRPVVLLLIPIIYALQVFRMALRRGLTGHGLRASATIMLAKFAEVAGAARFFLERSPQHSIEYKGS
jgi:cellulose synthase/poly-beta-1,6-N-acetylglucosamine synthase-like glycosyltransferase